MLTPGGGESEPGDHGPHHVVAGPYDAEVTCAGLGKEPKQTLAEGRPFWETVTPKSRTALNMKDVLISYDSQSVKSTHTA